MIDLFRRSPEFCATRQRPKTNHAVLDPGSAEVGEGGGIVDRQSDATLVQKIPLTSLTGTSNDIDEKNVALLVESFERIKQTSPVLVVAQPDGMFLTISGHHRARAAQTLKWDVIDAIVLTASERDLELIGIAENLHRRQVSVLSRAMSVARWCELALEGVQLERPAGGRQPQDRGIAKAAMILGFSRAEVHRCVQIARLSKEAAQAAIEFGLDSHRSALQRAAEYETISEQISVLRVYRDRKRQRRRLATSEATPMEKFSSVDAAAPLEELGQPAIPMALDDNSHLNSLITKWESFRQAFQFAPQLSRERFTRETLAAEKWLRELVSACAPDEGTQTRNEP
jgi:ParB family transcriptional regulator, chromosome partitioning protein